MKRTLTTCLAVFSLLLPLQPFAAKGGEAGPGDQAYDHASDKASFKRDGDDKVRKHQDDGDRDGPDSDKGKKSKTKKDRK